jgi:hypothetical protein
VTDASASSRERRKWLIRLIGACEGEASDLRERDRPDLLARMIEDLDELCARLRAELRALNSTA